MHDPLGERDRVVSPDARPPSDVRAVLRDEFARRRASFDDRTLDVLRVVLSEVLVNPDLRTLSVERVVLRGLESLLFAMPKHRI